MTSNSKVEECNRSLIKNSSEASISSNESGDGSESLSNHTTTIRSKKRVVDETLLPPEEAEKLLARRAYNRECASRARKRGNELVAQLEAQVKELQEDKDELRRSLLQMTKQVHNLEMQNKALLLRQIISDRDRNALAMVNVGSNLTYSLSRENARIVGGLPPNGMFAPGVSRDILNKHFNLARQHQHLLTSPTAVLP
jgi:TolA-binding protein